MIVHFVGSVISPGQHVQRVRWRCHWWTHWPWSAGRLPAACRNQRLSDQGLRPCLSTGFSTVFSQRCRMPFHPSRWLSTASSTIFSL